MSARLSSITVAFAANGAGVPSFLARLPERQSELGLSDGQLGLVLTGLAVGAFTMSPAAGRLVDRHGSRPVLVSSACAVGGLLPLLAVAPSGTTLFAALIAVGAGDAAMDIAMNANGAAYERQRERSVMHRLHASWSVGALAAAAFAGALAAGHVSPRVHLGVVGLAVAVGTAACRRTLATDGPVAPGRGVPRPAPGAASRPRLRLRLPRRPRQAHALAVLVLLAAGAAVVEGAPMDWASVRLVQSGATPGWATAGLGAFVGGMVAGRLLGDRLTDRRGTLWVVRLGMALVALGFVGGAVVAVPAVFVAGLVVAGFGAGWYVPVLFSASARMRDVESGLGVAAVSFGLRVGFLVEPLIVGGVGELGALRWAFPAVALIAVVLAVAASRLPAGEVRDVPTAAAGRDTAPLDVPGCT